MNLLEKIKKAWCILFRFEQALDIIVIDDEAKIPPILRSTLEYRRVTREFVTEDDMSDPSVVRMKINHFVDDLEMNPAIIKFFVLLKKNPQTDWGKGFPYQVKIYAFPKCLYEIEQR